MAKNNPFSMFRRNQKAWMAGLTLFTMFSFIALGSMLQCVGQHDQGGGPRFVGQVAKTNSFGTLDYNGFLSLRQDMLRFESFLNYLASAAQELNAMPAEELSSLRIQINFAANDAEALVNRWLVCEFAAKEKLGADDRAVVDYLSMLTRYVRYDQTGGGEVARFGSDVLLAAERNAGLNDSTLSDLIKSQIAYERMLRKYDGRRFTPFYAQMGLAQVGYGHGVVQASPAQKLEAFSALNRMAKAKVAVFKAENFVDKATAPTDEEAKAFYERYRDIVARANSKTPGFTQPQLLALEIVRADITDEILDAISEEDVKAYYEAHKEDFRRPKSPQPPVAEEEEAPAQETVSLGDDSAALNAIPEDALGNIGEEAPVEAPAAETPAEAPAEEPAAEQPAEEPAAEAPAEGAANYQKADLMLVAYAREAAQEEPQAPAEEPAAEQPAEEPAAEAPAEEPAAEAPAEEPAAEAPAEEPAAEAPAEEPAAEQPAEEPAAEAPAEEPAAEQPAEEPAAEAPAEEPVAEQPAEEPAAEAPAEEPASEEPAAVEDPDFFSLDVVEGMIRRRIAAERIEAKMAELNKSLQAQYRAQTVENNANAANVDMQAFAEENKFQYHMTSSADASGAAAPILVAQEMAAAADLLPADELDKIYSSAPLPYAPQRVGSYDASNVVQTWNIPSSFYVYRVLESKQQTRLDYEDQETGAVNEETKAKVVDAWKLQQAAKFAKEAAEAFAEKAKADGADFDALAAEAGAEVVETEKFSWFRSAFGQYGEYAQPAEVREVGVEVGKAARDNKGVVGADWDFYETVFGLEQGQIGVCMNGSEDRAFAVCVTEIDPEDKIREEFKSIGNDQATAYVQMWLNRRTGDLYHEAFIKQLQDRAGFEWLWIPRIEAER